LTTFEESLLLADAQVECPISAALTPRGGGVTYVTDLCAQSLFALPSGSTTPEFLADVGDNVEVDKRGRVYVAGGDTLLGVDPTTDPVEVETIRTIDEAWLNGFAVTLTGIAYIADSSPLQPAVYKVDVTTGELLATYTSPEFRNPEDVAIAPNGDVYVSDSAFTQPPSNYLPGLYLIPSGGTTVETLYQRGDPGGPDEGDLGDPVDILLTPFQGF
jgi:DNA-binding beta-propeller fold protein YncE